MAMGRNIRVSGRYIRDENYSLLIEQRSQDQSLIVYNNNTIQTITTDKLQSLRGEYDQICDGYALLGNLSLPVEGGYLHFLVIVTQCTSVGKLRQCEVYKVGQVKCISLRGHSQDSDRGVVTEISRLIAGGCGYFAWSPAGAGDVSVSAQKSRQMDTDPQYFWNKLLYLPYIRSGVALNSWLVKLMLGSVEIRTVYSGATQIRAALISRLSCNRVGTRYHTRGLDDDGHVANHVETEQLVFTDNDVSSFVQIRGSVPLFWEQPGVNVGSHKVKFSRGMDLTRPAFEKQFSNLMREYKDVVILNLLGISLVGSKEGEATLSSSYQEQQSKTSYKQMKHYLYDFHAEGGGKNLEKLWSRISETVEQQSFFCSVTGSVQAGVIRTNCMDCLDRSNVSQAMLGHKMVSSQLYRLVPDIKDMTVSRLEDMFHQMWISNGNNLSKLYAGTGALSQGGSKILDGARSAARTIQNNLLDGDKQEAFDVLVRGRTKQNDFSDRASLVLPPYLFHAPIALQRSICENWSKFSKHYPLRVAVGNYNINGGKHFRSVVFKDKSLDDWLLQDKSDLVTINNDSKQVDIYAVGFQEMVDLDTKNIVNTSGENARLWCQELMNTLNKDVNNSFSLVNYTQLVGVCLYVFVRSSLAPFIRDVLVDQVKTGMGGTTGNKGTVGISLTYATSSLVFLCSHFAAGQSQVAERNNDYQEAIRRIQFANGRTALSHDYVFWCGDFNYRINMEREDVIEMVKKQKYSDLLTCDQLVQEQSAGNVFQGFREGKINFAPTYKYDLFSDDYDTSEKCRVPAYCDRVLFTRRKPPRGWSDGDIVSYTRADLKQSDHRPVLAVFDVQVRDVDIRERDKVIGDIVSNCGSYDGRVLVTPASDLVFSAEMVENIAKYLAHIGQIVQISQLREGIMLCFDSVDKLHQIIGKNIVVSDINWKVVNHCDNQTLTENEFALFGFDRQNEVDPIKTHRKSAPARPSAPPGLRPSRPAPGVPPPVNVNKLSLAEQIDNLSDDDQAEVVKPKPSLASLDWPDDPPAVKLAPLTWPEPESSESPEPPNLPPPSPPPSRSLDQPPPFTPPSLNQEHSRPPPFSPPVLSTCPPTQPPPPPPRVPARPAARLPPPVPKR